LTVKNSTLSWMTHVIVICSRSVVTAMDLVGRSVLLMRHRSVLSPVKQKRVENMSCLG
jgi:hypothetical protein